MTTSDDMREVKELLDDGLISQHDYDEEKGRFLRAREKSRELHIEFQKRELEVREEALEAPATRNGPHQRRSRVRRARFGRDVVRARKRLGQRRNLRRVLRLVG